MNIKRNTDITALERRNLENCVIFAAGDPDKKLPLNLSCVVGVHLCCKASLSLFERRRKAEREKTRRMGRVFSHGENKRKVDFMVDEKMEG